MMAAIESGRLPLGQELDILKTADWARLADAAKQRIISQLMGMFAQYHGSVVRYAPILASNSDYYRQWTDNLLCRWKCYLNIKCRFKLFMEYWCYYSKYYCKFYWYIFSYCNRRV